MNDVTAKEVDAQRERATAIMFGDAIRKWTMGDGTAQAVSDAIATTLATVRKEARREGLKQAWAKVEEMMMAAKTGEKFLQSKRIAAAIRALMEPT